MLWTIVAILLIVILAPLAVSVVLEFFPLLWPLIWRVALVAVALVGILILANTDWSPREEKKIEWGEAGPPRSIEEVAQRIKERRDRQAQAQRDLPLKVLQALPEDRPTQSSR